MTDVPFIVKASFIATGWGVHHDSFPSDSRKASGREWGGLSAPATAEGHACMHDLTSCSPLHRWAGIRSGHEAGGRGEGLSRLQQIGQAAWEGH